ncbi:putative hydrolase [Caenibius tardaugens NBRC 16725]|uniref:Putative hydrolase n=1 Tax=Caenibius tardaugens NBRC 16725 TaxID=1219035 RepID=U2YLV4_9SPHN|nr:metallophosphoesterase family protein [Caenibius tardaugens]AZI36726.1 serine/threonine protein phosphatase [Caenibius tardaugens NBRC 16725]GAD49392.1 putative hydrolase [Caenibius tardaugens NBRC 16725]
MNPSAIETTPKLAIDAGKARIPAGQRVYAIGDIHGRLDLLEALAHAIELDAATAPAQSMVLLLGDLIDRGRDSAGVIDYVLAWQERRPVRVLMGNHEEVFLAAFTDTEYLRRLLPYGARETLISYGIDAHITGPDALQRMQAAMASRIPSRHREFMAALELSAVIGDYLFVHAGIEPGIPVADQSAQAMRWIRDPFLMHEGLFEKVVVHGHTIRTEVEERPNRIGIDTGAYCYGLLTALVLEGGERRFIQAREQEDGAIAILHREAA